MKKSAKILSAVLALALAAALSVGGTLAYLSSEEEVSNTFTVGQVHILVNEAKVGPNGKTFEGAGRVPTNRYKLIPGAVLDKDPTVTVVAGSEECYVRALVTINNKAALDDIFADVEGHADLNKIFGGRSSDWIYKGASVEGDTITYELRYKEKVPYSSEKTVLPPLFTTVNVPGFLTNEDLSRLEDFSIDVVAQAIQANTFEDADAAWIAFNAQAIMAP